jgi:Domain of unknown function (DUF4145)
VTASDNAPDVMSIDCPDCDAHVIAEPKGYVTYYEPREGPPGRWTLLACREKGHPLLVVQDELAPGMSFDEDKPHRVYPAQDRRLSTVIPSELRSTHEEARKCFGAKAYRATVVMCGITLEGACQLQGAKRATLQKMLKEMKDDGKIDSRLWEWADGLRLVRNSSAHFNDERATRQDARDCLEFSEALLDYMFVLTARFEAMKERRARNDEAPK